ncbi:MAG: hypothetical protein HYS98_02970 [Deltaproteobacteria bacterium]|nr:hypothetical protein [Deltaproteobacteria bacterium]
MKLWLHKSWRITFSLYKILIPLIFIIEILKRIGAIEILGNLLSPLMNIVGLSGDMGIVLASAMITNIYGGITAYATIASHAPLNAAEVGILGTMMLMAHNLLVEIKIAHKSGLKILPILFFRIFSSFLFGMFASLIFKKLGLFQDSTVITWKVSQALWVSSPLFNTVLHQAWQLFLIFLIITLLVGVLNILELLGFTKYLTRFLHPVLKPLGIGSHAIPTVVIGLTLGLAYGGGLIIEQSHSGAITHREILFSHLLLGISHSYIEDSALVMMIGAPFLIVVPLRFIFAFLLVFLSEKIIGDKMRFFLHKQ